MKTRSSLVTAGLCGVLVSNAWGQNNAATPAAPTRAPSAAGASRSPQPRPAHVEVQAKQDASASASESSAKPHSRGRDDKAAKKASRAHVTPARRMDTPPPPPRAETKPPAPAAGHVWKPGHWEPVKGEWQWTAGEWAIPVTPVSVWIEAKYDAKTKQWSPGYWQPDTPDSYETETPTPSNPP